MNAANCWEYHDCGREAGGANAADLGVCPAFTLQAGDACWLIGGTFCKGTVQGTFAQKEASCMSCEFYRKFDLQHRSAMRTKYAEYL